MLQSWINWCFGFEQKTSTANQTGLVVIIEAEKASNPKKSGDELVVAPNCESELVANGVVQINEGEKPVSSVEIIPVWSRAALTTWSYVSPAAKVAQSYVGRIPTTPQSYKDLGLRTYSYDWRKTINSANETVCSVSQTVYENATSENIAHGVKVTLDALSSGTSATVNAATPHVVGAVEAFKPHVTSTVQVVTPAVSNAWDATKNYAGALYDGVSAGAYYTWDASRYYGANAARWTAQASSATYEGLKSIEWSSVELSAHERREFCLKVNGLKHSLGYRATLALKPGQFRTSLVFVLPFQCVARIESNYQFSRNAAAAYSAQWSPESALAPVDPCVKTGAGQA